MIDPKKLLKDMRSWLPIFDQSKDSLIASKDFPMVKMLSNPVAWQNEKSKLLKAIKLLDDHIVNPNDGTILSKLRELSNDSVSKGVLYGTLAMYVNAKYSSSGHYRPVFFSTPLNDHLSWGPVSPSPDDVVGDEEEGGAEEDTQIGDGVLGEEVLMCDFQY